MRFLGEMEQVEVGRVKPDRTERGPELRRDPITNTWVLQMNGDTPPSESDGCVLCPGTEASELHTIYQQPWGDSNWQVRVVPHLDPLYCIEGDARRRGE